MLLAVPLMKERRIMEKMRLPVMLRSVMIGCMVCVIISGASCNDAKLELINLKKGFSIELYAPDVPGARSMTITDKGTLFVGTREKGKVYAVMDKDGDKKADSVLTIASGLYMPNGVVFHKGDLYVAEVNRILKYPDIESHIDDPPEPQIINDSFPVESHHGWKYIDIGPDNLLYVPLGAPCNICDPADGRYATIMRMNLDGSNLEIFARGVRNTVGFDWHPRTKELWFTDNGRDRLGDNRPPDELNCAYEKGLHFGYPYCHGSNISDPEFGENHPCNQFTGPRQELGPHVAALGILFYTGDMFPAEYKNQIFIAEHGSWNRSVPIGYRVTLVRVEGRQARSYEVFADGWLQGKIAWGRPVDIVGMKDGSLLVSDDRLGCIYRISYKK
jgi:glucose/arabinose dehydrogenase